jgi:integrase
MPKIDFTTADLDTLPVGVHSDGTGLEYRVSQRGGRSWFVTYKVHGQWSGMGIGPATRWTLVTARKEVDRIRRMAAKGLDPKQQREDALAATGGREERRKLPTVGEFGDAWFGAIKSKNAKVLQKYKREIEVYALPIRDKRLDQVEVADVVAMLKPLWETIPVAAREFQKRLRRMFSAAKVLHNITKPNPAAWQDNLEHLLDRENKRGKIRGPHPSMPHEEIADFVATLRTKETIGMKALLFVILTGGRSEETAKATWREIDLTKKQWLIDGKRMKNGSDAIIPLCPPAMALLRELHAARRPGPDGTLNPDEYVFSADGIEAISDGTLLRCLQVYMKRPDCTVHGFRSTFRTWGQEKTDFDHDTLEHCIHHITGDKQVVVYKRGAAVEKRTVIMNAWAEYCLPTKPPLQLVA